MLIPSFLWLTSFSSMVSGHPRMSKVAVFDIITPDLEWGPAASAAEVISILHACLNTFANIGQHYDIHISHSKGMSLHDLPNINLTYVPYQS